MSETRRRALTRVQHAGAPYYSFNANERLKLTSNETYLSFF